MAFLCYVLFLESTYTCKNLLVIIFRMLKEESGIKSELHHSKQKMSNC